MAAQHSALRGVQKRSRRLLPYAAYQAVVVAVGLAVTVCNSPLPGPSAARWAARAAVPAFGMTLFPELMAAAANVVQQNALLFMGAEPLPPHDVAGFSFMPGYVGPRGPVVANDMEHGLQAMRDVFGTVHESLLITHPYLHACGGSLWSAFCTQEVREG